MCHVFLRLQLTYSVYWHNFTSGDLLLSCLKLHRTEFPKPLVYLFWKLNQGWHPYSQAISNSFSTCPLLSRTQVYWRVLAWLPNSHGIFAEQPAGDRSIKPCSSQSSLPATSWKVEISQDTVLRHIRRLKAQCIFVTFHSVCRFTNSEVPEDV